MPPLVVQLLQQAPSASQPIERDLWIAVEFLQAKLQFFVGAVAEIGIVGRILFTNRSGEGVVLPPQPTGILPQPVVTLDVAQRIGEVDVPGHIAGPARANVEIVHHRAEGGPVFVGGIHPGSPPGDNWHGPSRLNVVTGVVVVLRVIDRADDGVAVGDLRQSGQFLAHQQPGGLAGNRTIGTPNPLGGLGLQIERLKLAGPPEEEDEQYRLGGGVLHQPRLLGGQQVIGRKPQQARPPGPQHIPPTPARAGGLGCPQNPQHGSPRKRRAQTGLITRNKIFKNIGFHRARQAQVVAHPVSPAPGAYLSCCDCGCCTTGRQKFPRGRDRTWTTPPPERQPVNSHP